VLILAEDRRPVGGRDYPRAYQEFRSWFPEEATCREYLAGCVGRAGSRVRAAAAVAVGGRAPGLWMRADCGLKTSATAGTLHHPINRQHLPYYLDEFTFRFNRECRGLVNASGALLHGTDDQSWHHRMDPAALPDATVLEVPAALEPRARCLRSCGGATRAAPCTRNSHVDLFGHLSPGQALVTELKDLLCGSGTSGRSPVRMVIPALRS
jgi:hypothetical protein